MADHERPRHRSKKHKHAREDRRERSERRRRDHDSDDEAAAPQPTLMPWRCMKFQLIDSVNGYAAERQEIDGSCIVHGATFNMGSFSGLVNYVRETFEIDLELLGAAVGGSTCC